MVLQKSQTMIICFLEQQMRNFRFPLKKVLTREYTHLVTSRDGHVTKIEKTKESNGVERISLLNEFR